MKLKFLFLKEGEPVHGVAKEADVMLLIRNYDGWWYAYGGDLLYAEILSEGPGIDAAMKVIQDNCRPSAIAAPALELQQALRNFLSIEETPEGVSPESLKQKSSEPETLEGGHDDHIPF